MRDQLLNGFPSACFLREYTTDGIFPNDITSIPVHTVHKSRKNLKGVGSNSKQPSNLVLTGGSKTELRFLGDVFHSLMQGLPAVPALLASRCSSAATFGCVVNLKWNDALMVGLEPSNTVYYRSWFFECIYIYIYCMYKFRCVSYSNIIIYVYTMYSHYDVIIYDYVIQKIYKDITWIFSGLCLHCVFQIICCPPCLLYLSHAAGLVWSCPCLLWYFFHFAAYDLLHSSPLGQKGKGPNNINPNPYHPCMVSVYCIYLHLPRKSTKCR